LIIDQIDLRRGLGLFGGIGIGQSPVGTPALGETTFPWGLGRIERRLRREYNDRGPGSQRREGKHAKRAHGGQTNGLLLETLAAQAFQMDDQIGVAERHGAMNP